MPSANIQVPTSATTRKGQPHVGHQKPSVSSSLQMGFLRSPGSKLTSEERFALSSNVRSASTSSATAKLRAPKAHTPTPGQGRPGHLMHGSTRSRRAETRGSASANKAPISQQGRGSGLEPVVPLKLSTNRWVPASTTRRDQPHLDSPELVHCKVKSLLNKLTMDKFESISDEIILWANRSVNEKDGRTLIQVIRLVFEKATDEVALSWSEMYARLCRKMMEQISPEVQDEGVKDKEGKPITGGHLFRKYLLNRCQEDFERGWCAREGTAANDTTGSDEYYAAQKVKRQGLGLITFIGELFKVRMLTERIMHECVKKLLGNVENTEEEEIESLCQLLKTVGQLLDTPKACAHMDVYFARMKELAESLNISTRMQFMLQDVIELRDRVWMNRNAAPTTIAAVHVLVAKERAAAEESLNRQMSMSRGGSRRGGDRNQEHGPDGWAAADGSVPQVTPKAGDMLQFGKITEGQDMGMGMGPSGVFAVGIDSKQGPLSRTNSSSNVFHMLSQSREPAAEASTNPSRSSSRKSSVDSGHGTSAPEPAVQRRKLQLLPRSILAAEDSTMTPLEDECGSAPTTMSEADVKMQIDRYVKEFFAVRGLEEADVYFINRPHELCFRLEDNRQIRTSGGGPRLGGEGNKKHGPGGWVAAGGFVPWAPPNAGDLSQFGKISMGAPTVMGPSSVFAGSKKDNKQETLSRQNSSSDMLHVLSQNPELAPGAEPSRPSGLKPRVNLAHAGVLEPAVQCRKLQLLPPSVIAAEENVTILSKEEPESTPTVISEADAKKVDEDVKEFFAVRNLNEADDYFLKLPHEHRFRLVDKLVAFALESREADARLVGDFFAQATSNGQCTLEVFEGGFMPMVEFLDDIAIDAPKAFDYMAIMLKGAGFQNDPERFQRIASKLEDSDKLISLVA